MVTAALPTLGQLKLRMTFIVSLVTVTTTVLIILFLAPALEFGPEEKRFFLWEALFAIGSMGPAAYLVQRYLCGAIFEYVRRQPLDEVTPELRHEAFAQTLRLPGAMFKFAAPCYPLGGFVAGGVAVLHVEAWGAANLGVMVAAACAIGLVTQILAYLFYKVVLEPVRAVLAAEIEDPDERMAAAPMLPMGRKLFTLVASMTVCTVYFTLSLAFGHASTLIEENAIVTHPEILAVITQRIGETGDPEASVREAQRVYAPAGVMFSLLDPAQSASEALSTANGLVEREIRYILTQSEKLAESVTGNSMNYDSDNSFTWTVLPGDGRILAASTPQEVVNPNLDAVGAKIGVVAALFIGISMLIAWLASRELHGAITTFKNNIQRVASGDLTPGEHFESEDEMGELARSLDIMSESLRGIVSQVADTNSRVEESSDAIAAAGANVAAVTREQVGHIQRVKVSMKSISSQVAGISSSSRSLSESVEESSSSVSELSSMGLELDRNASTLSARAQESSTSTEQMIESIRKVAAKTDGLASKVQDASSNMQSMVNAVGAVEGHASETTQLADRVRKASEHGRDRVEQTIQGMEEIREATDAAYGIIQNLGTRTQEIGGILNVIDGVAAETSLLALNAAIIAAQAGEHGKAFAVVAEQVKGLATRVLSSTKEIGDVIHGLQEEGTNAVGAVERGVERVMTGVNLSAEAGRSLEEIESTVSATEDQIAQIVTAVKEQSQATQKIVVVIEDILAGFADIQRAGEEQRSGSDQVLRNTADAGQVAQQVHLTAQEQTTAARHIAQNMENIREAVEHTHAALQEQSSGVERVAEAMDEMLGRTNTNEESVEQMTAATVEMLERAEALRKQIRNFKF